MNECVDIGIKQCESCFYHGNICWVTHYKNIILASSKDEFKNYFINSVGFKTMWTDYFIQTVKEFFPEKVDMINAILLLQGK